MNFQVISAFCLTNLYSSSSTSDSKCVSNLFFIDSIITIATIHVTLIKHYLTALKLLMEIYILTHAQSCEIAS